MAAHITYVTSATMALMTSSMGMNSSMAMMGNSSMHTSSAGTHDVMNHNGHAADMESSGEVMDMGHGSHDQATDTGSTASHGEHATTGHYGWFHTTYDTVVLFEKITTDSWQAVLISCVVICCVAVVYEGFKLFREKLARKAEEEEEEQFLSICSCYHILQSVLHMIQVFTSYLLMLVFMTFNAYFCVAVILGAGFGYFLFRWKPSGKNTSYDLNSGSSRNYIIDDHCNT